MSLTDTIDALEQLGRLNVICPFVSNATQSTGFYNFHDLQKVEAEKTDTEKRRQKSTLAAVFSPTPRIERASANDSIRLG